MEYTKEYLERLISDRIEENGQLEYKAAASLARDEAKSAEITKDISAFANAAGGVLIYGIAEPRDKAFRHFPERLDPVNQAEFSREWLDQKIALIRPRIEGTKIIPVHVGPAVSDYCYVVEIPQGSRAHQARDFRYYKRRNFESTPMDDYEVQDVSNRRKHPSINCLIRIVIPPFPHEDQSKIQVELRNESRVMARYFAAIVRMPLRLTRAWIIPEDAVLDMEDGLQCWRFAFRRPLAGPLFPGGSVTANFELKLAARIEPEPGPSIPDIRITLYADEMEKVEVKKDVAAALIGWT